MRHAAPHCQRKLEKKHNRYSSSRTDSDVDIIHVIYVCWNVSGPAEAIRLCRAKPAKEKRQRRQDKANRGRTETKEESYTKSRTDVERRTSVARATSGRRAFANVTVDFIKLNRRGRAGSVDSSYGRRRVYFRLSYSFSMLL